MCINDNSQFTIMKGDKYIAVIIYGFYTFIILFGLASIMRPNWLEDLAVDGRKTEAQTYVEKGNQLMYQGKFMEAIPQYQKALEIDTTSKNIYGNLAIAYLNIGDFEMADENLNEVEKRLEGLDSIAMFSSLITRGDLEKAIGFSKNGQRKNLENAYDYYAKAINLMPYEVKIIYKQAHLAMQMGLDSIAIQGFQRGILYDSRLETMYYAALYKEYMKAADDKDEQKLADLESCIYSKEPIDWNKYDTISLRSTYIVNTMKATAYSNLGELYYRNGYFDEANKAFENSISINLGMSAEIEKIKERYKNLIIDK